MKYPFRYIIAKMSKAKHRKENLESSKRKTTHHVHKRIPIRSTNDFSSEVTESRRQWGGIFKVLKENTVNQEFYIQQNYLAKMNAK